MKRIFYLIFIILEFLLFGCTTENPSTFTLNTSSNPLEAGVVSPRSGVYDDGTQVEITAIPNDGWEFQEWQGSYIGIQNPAVITMNSDKSATAVYIEKIISESKVGYLSPFDFNNDNLTISLSESNSGSSYIVTVPNLSSVDYFHRNKYIHEQLITFDLVVEPSVSTPTSLRSLPDINKPPLNKWEQPETGVKAELKNKKTFYVWSQKDQTYVTTNGKLAFDGDSFAIYEDVTNNENFSEGDYLEMNNILEDHIPRLTELMGEPTDLDGNDHIIVFISRTLMDIRNSGEAYVDGCHMRISPGGCQERGEFVYIMSLDNFSNSTNDKEFFVRNYFPRNILHETTHLLQQSHWYRLDMPNENFSIPAFYSEGQAELISYKTPGLRGDEIWNSLRNKFSSTNQERLNPWFSPYDFGALFYWYMHQTFGDGFSQALINSGYNPDKTNTSFTELTVGIHEPLLLALMYGSLLLDGTEVGTEIGLEFVKDDIQTRLSDTSLPIREVYINDSVQEKRSYTGYAIFKINHAQPVNVELTVKPESAFVLVIQP